jgi:hypothetical protein
MTKACQRTELIIAKPELMSVLVGASLGVASFSADLLPEPTSELVAAVVSSAFGWGLTALVASSFSRTRGSSIFAGIAVLVSAAITYYGLILFVSQRWQLGVEELQNGSSLLPMGLGSVARAAGFWLSGAIIGGVLIGWLAHTIQIGVQKQISIGIGLTLGILLAEASYAVIFAAFIWVKPLDGSAWRHLISALLQFFLAAVALSIVIRRRERPISWPALLLALSVSMPLGAIVWSQVDLVRTSL